MTPQIVRFTGLTVPTDALLYPFHKRKIPAPYPANWTRIQFNTKTYEDQLLTRTDLWLSKNIAGRWGSYERDNGTSVVIMFESDDDAMIFKLMGGDTACLETQEMD